MTTLRSALIATLGLAILHLLTMRVSILPGVHVPVLVLVAVAEVAAIVGLVVIVARRFRADGYRPAWAA